MAMLRLETNPTKETAHSSYESRKRFRVDDLGLRVLGLRAFIVSHIDENRKEGNLFDCIVFLTPK
jgi:hypothetical protein